MAHTVPETIRSSATTGERLVFRTLKRYLPDDYRISELSSHSFRGGMKARQDAECQ